MTTLPDFPVLLLTAVAYTRCSRLSDNFVLPFLSGPVYATFVVWVDSTEVTQNGQGLHFLHAVLRSCLHFYHEKGSNLRLRNMSRPQQSVPG